LDVCESNVEVDVAGPADTGEECFLFLSRLSAAEIEQETL
jgi:hypothetical protein